MSQIDIFSEIEDQGFDDKRKDFVPFRCGPYKGRMPTELTDEELEEQKTITHWQYTFGHFEKDHIMAVWEIHYRKNEST